MGWTVAYVSKCTSVYTTYDTWIPVGTLPTCAGVPCRHHLRSAGRGELDFPLITMQNLVGIDAVVLIICTFFDFASLA